MGTKTAKGDDVQVFSMIRVPNIFPRGCEVRQGKAPKDLILARKVLNTPSRSLSFSLKK